MMYSNKLVACIKIPGKKLKKSAAKVCREYGDTILLPFGSEYIISLKNLNSVKAVINITIDGVDVVEGGLVVNPNQEIDLERFVKNGNLSVGNSFKFIERTSKIEAGPRGIKVEDGLIRVSFKFAKVMPKTEYVDHHIYHRDVHHWHGYPHWDRVYGPGYSTTWSSTNAIGSADPNKSGMMRGVTSNSISGAVNCSATANTISAQGFGITPLSDVKSYAPTNDIGITVPGSESTQKFQMVQEFPLEDTEHVMVLRLLGDTGQVEVKEAVTVKAKQKCTTCDKLNKATAKFCSECGTALEVFV